MKSKLNCICQENYYGNTLLEVWAKVTEEAKNVHHKLVCSPPKSSANSKNLLSTLTCLTIKIYEKAISISVHDGQHLVAV